MSVLKRTFVGLLVAVLILVVSVCAITYTVAPMHSSNMGTAECPFLGHGGAVCGMNPLGHLGGMQLALAAVIPSVSVVFLLLLASLFVVLSALLPEWVPVSIALAYEPPDTRTYTYDPLKRYAARGLLNPKIP